MPHEEFRKAITALDTRTLQPNFVVQLMKLLPTDQEVAALQSYTVSIALSRLFSLFFFLSCSLSICIYT